jgi:hypothetical protein
VARRRPQATNRRPRGRTSRQFQSCAELAREAGRRRCVAVTARCGSASTAPGPYCSTESIDRIACLIWSAATHAASDVDEVGAEDPLAQLPEDTAWTAGAVAGRPPSGVLHAAGALTRLVKRVDSWFPGEPAEALLAQLDDSRCANRRDTTRCRLSREMPIVDCPTRPASDDAGIGARQRPAPLRPAPGRFFAAVQPRPDSRATTKAPLRRVRLRCRPAHTGLHSE